MLRGGLLFMMGWMTKGEGMCRNCGTSPLSIKCLRYFSVASSNLLHFGLVGATLGDEVGSGSCNEE